MKIYKRLTSRRGKLKIIYSDNPITFKAGAKWLANNQRSETPGFFEQKDRNMEVQHS